MVLNLSWPAVSHYNGTISQKSKNTYNLKLDGLAVNLDGSDFL